MTNRSAKASLVLTGDNKYIVVYSPDGYDDDVAEHRIMNALVGHLENALGGEEDE